MAKKKVKKTPKRKVAKKKPSFAGPVYCCTSCGTEVVLTTQGAAFCQLLCCSQPMGKKS